MKTISIYGLEINVNDINTNYFKIDPEIRAKEVKKIIKNLKNKELSFIEKNNLIKEITKLLVISALSHNGI